MQIKKRAKSIEFGKKLQPPKSVHHEPKQSSHSQDDIDEDKRTPLHSEHKAVLHIEDNEIAELPASSSDHQNDPPPANEPVTSDNPPHTPHQSLPESSHALSEEPSQPVSDSAGTSFLAHAPEMKSASDDPELTEKNKEELSFSDQSVVSEPHTQTHDQDTFIIEKEIKKSMLGYFIIIAIISFLIGLASMAGINYFMNNSKLQSDIPYLSNLISTPTPTPKPTLTPTPTPKIINLAAYNIDILNGSGITGAASSLKKTLTEADFKVNNTGNAATSDYTNTVLQLSKNIDPDYLKELRNTLKKTYTLGADEKIPSSYAGSADIIIIIGSK